MDLSFKVSARIAKPVAEVFEAVVNPDHLSQYFTTGGARGRLETGATVTWDFHDFPGAFPVHVVEVEPERRIVFRWEATDCAPEAGEAQAGEAGAGEAQSGEAQSGEAQGDSYDTTVTMTFEPLDGGRRTLVSIAEEGWRRTPEGLKSSYGNCQGWMQMACAMKAWLEHGINLREGMFR